ncbi:hypothetical protein [Nitrococcus mobilis]|uniref:Uncharacterized protein n=1 Tax=Nitrococcus mobilis Nb-231 TaxID=314278 RepID=A4BTD8_9GAMM|nr:hypothetical protein [Nitrococcus mobilis]EAR21040.1 hypothetical protein NB231_07717 [Nitrococcus mobilis Nb-231]
MSDHEKQSQDEQLRQLSHDVRECLHAIGLGTELLKNLREDEARFAEICEAIDNERKTAQRLMHELIHAATHDNSNRRAQ